MPPRKRKMSQVVDEIVSRYERSRSQYSLKTLEDEVRAAYDRGEVAEDPIGERIAKAVKARDKASRNDPDNTLDFGDFTFPHVLTIGRNERMPSGEGKLEHVLADQTIKHENKIAQDVAFLRLEQRNLALLPYLQRGQTVSAAAASYRADHEGP